MGEKEVIELRHASGGIAYREAGPPDAPVALMVHGWPYSSYFFEPALEHLAAKGIRGVAIDLAGFGDSEPDPPGTWEHHAESLERLRSELGLGRVALVGHDWGVSIALRWAASHRGDVSALVVTNGAAALVEGRWHPVAEDLRSSGEGEAFMRYLSRDLFDAGIRQVSPGLSEAARDEYWKCMADEDRRARVLELFRSADPEALVAYVDEPERLAVPTLVLWGDQDDVAPLSVAHHFRDHTPGAVYVEIPGAGHALFSDAPEAAGAALADFLAVELL